MRGNEARDELLEYPEARSHAPRGTGLLPIGGALLAGVVGACAWAAISITANFEIGWIAWGIGAAVGAAYHKLGGRAGWGPILCAVISVASIGAGKYVSFTTAVGDSLEAYLDDEVLRPEYEAVCAFGEQYAAAEPAEREQLAREWLSDEGQDPATVTARRLASFEQSDLPNIEAIRDGRKSYAEFAEEIRDGFRGEVSFADTLSPFDLLWVVLGIATAARLAAAVREKPAPPA